MGDETHAGSTTAHTVRTPHTGPPPTLVGDRYELLSVLGSGGWGTVHKAYDRQLEEFVALKLLHDVGEVAASRLRQEVKLSRRVSHRNVVRVFDIGEAGGQKFLTMELVEGESLLARIARVGAMPRPVFLHLARQIATGVAAAHFAGVAHCDIKPGNVLLRWDEAKVADFGIARAYATGRDFSGTPAYMAPEQIASAEGTARGDVYSLGVLFFEMTSGQRPFRENTLPLAYEERMRRGALDLSAVRSDVDPSIVALIRACTEIDPAARPESAADVRDVLNAVPLDIASGGGHVKKTAREESTFEIARKARFDITTGFRYGWLAVVERMEEALRGEPDNATFLSWLAIALAYGFSVDWLAEDAMVERARAAADRAKEIAPFSALPYVAGGAIARALGDHVEAAAQLSAALARDPSSPDANHALGELLAACGDVGAGLSHLHAARDADPSQPAIAWSLARVHAIEGDTEAFERLAVAPGAPAPQSTYWAQRIDTMAFMTQERLRRDQEAAAAQEFDLRPAVLATLQVYLGASTEEDGMLAILRESGSAGSPRALRRRDRMRRFLADICARFGRPDAALDALEDCDRAGTIEVVWMRRSPALAVVRDTPRYAAVLEHTAKRAAAVLAAARRAPW